MLFAFFEKKKKRGQWSSSRHFYVFSLKLVLLAVSNLCPFIDSLVTLTTGPPDMYPCSSSIRIRERDKLPNGRIIHSSAHYSISQEREREREISQNDGGRATNSFLRCRRRGL
jgi:hypothetical protein